MLTCYYDLARCLPSYDIVTFLMASEHERLKRKEDSLAIEILPGPHEGFRPGNLWPPATADRRAMMQNVVLPMCALLPSCERVTVHDDRVPQIANSFGYGSFTIGMERFVAAMAAGVRPLRLDQPVVRDSHLVTITSREAEHWPARNSTLTEWTKAARELEGLGYRVVFVRDTCKADEPLESFETFPGASRDLARRAQLYLGAGCNLFVSNGPAWFALALDAPVAIIRPATDGAGKLSSHAALASAGLPKGSQIPGTPGYQVLVWDDDRAGVIVQTTAGFMNQRLAS